MKSLKHHPSLELLNAFHQGTLSTGQSVAIAAHIEMCPICSEQSKLIEQRTASDWLEASAPNEPEDNFSDLLESITTQPQEAPSLANEVKHRQVHMLDKSIELPKVLAKASSTGLRWKKVTGCIDQAAVDLDSETQCNLLYMKPGGKVPPHKHQGYEITLVLEGEFKDDQGTYHAGDFLLRKGDQKHTPYSDNGCLCFTVLDAPLTFTSGIARLLNPFNHYLFNRDAQRRSQA